MLILDFRVWEKTSVGGREPQFYYSHDPTQWGQQWCNVAWGAARGGWPVELYTGLKDSKGQKIYEGDIIIAPKRRKLTYWVTFDGNEPSKNLVAVHDNEKTGLGYDVIGLTEYIKQFGTPEIIGNIHENLELLGGEYEK